MAVMKWSEAFPPTATFTEANIPDQSGRVFIITGGTSGCGFELAKAVYNLNGRIYIAGRSQDRVEAAIDKIKSSPAAPHPNVETGKGSLHFLYLDLEDMPTVKSAADEFMGKEERLDVIWHNAGIMGVPDGSKTKQGFETHIGVNAFAPWLFQHFLTPLCLRTAARSEVQPFSTRVIWVSSAGHRGSPQPDGVNWDDVAMHDKKGFMSGVMVKYGQSKAMNVMHAHEFARRYGEKGLLSVSLHPGNLKSNLTRHQSWLFRALTNPLLYDAHHGALTELFAGFADAGQEEGRMVEEGGKNGSFVEPWGRWGTEEGNHVFDGLRERNTGERLWALCEEWLPDEV
ncbi:hypothetical protein BDV96DRAFT_655737 [Lophiotrema nucula]|uniref:Short-chain dehydrogenase n=1 Tax=Lophiotrema nucula TaxID=690887 RepID=A0A6A5YF46_9PLEO|nr:hypothetical protein BDV96DRAFT_655737 [Lophiotrema nucula]